jgi:PST family polysaccharide transporter
MFRRDVANLVIRLPTIVLGLYLGGLPGIVYARALTSGVAIVINMHLVRTFIGVPIRQQIAANWRALASVGAMTVVVWVLRDAVGTTGSTTRMLGVLVLLAAAGAAVYGTTTWMLWALAGRPDGPERQVARILTQLADKARAFRRPAA